MQKRVSFLPTAVVSFFLCIVLVSSGSFFATFLGRSGFEKAIVFLQATTFSLTPFLSGGQNDKKMDEQLGKLGDRGFVLTQEREIQALRDQFQTTSIPSKQLLPARIIGFVGFIPRISRPVEIVLDRGTDDNIQVGHAVIYRDNLVGKVTKTSGSRSLVALLSKSGWSFTAKTGKTNANGLATIEGGDIFLKNVLLSDILEKGDLVLMKGDETMNEGGFPPDIVVGEILSVDKKASALFQTAKMKSRIDVTKLSTVFVYVTK